MAGQFTPGSRTTLRTRPPLLPSVREYTPARSADRHRPEAHWRSPSILSPAVTATGTTFCAAIVVRRLVAADRSSWVVGLLVGWVVVRLVVVWRVVGSVVVAVGMNCSCFGLGEGLKRSRLAGSRR